MSNKIKHTVNFLIAFLLLSEHAVAVVCDNPNAAETVRVYFVNGMNNTPEDIDRNANSLLDLVRETRYRTFGRSINNKESFLTQLLKVYRERSSETSKFWEWLHNLSIAPQWFKSAFNTELAAVSNYAVYNDFDLKLMVEEYLQDLNSGKKVVLVAHSEGNFYANNAYQFIKTNYPQFENSIGIVAVGTPSSRVQDGGPHTTNSLDLIINLVRLRYPVLPANMTYNEPDSRKNHSFVGTYITGAGGKIRGDVLDT